MNDKPAVLPLHITQLPQRSLQSDGAPTMSHLQILDKGDGSCTLQMSHRCPKQAALLRQTAQTTKPHTLLHVQVMEYKQVQATRL